MNVSSLALYFILPVVTAFSSVTVPYGARTDVFESPTPDTEASGAITASSPWRVVLDIGREPLANMPFDWARSGCRMPLKIPCDLSLTENNGRLVEPQSDTVSFTGPEGAVIRPINGGSFECDEKSKNQHLSFSLQFPETLARRDVTIEAGTTLQCTGRFYTQSELDRLNQEFYQARDQAWELGGELNDMVNVEGPPKKWNEELQRWETKSKTVNPLEWAQKRLSYMAAKAKQGQTNDQRPDLNSLSERGSLPGVEDSVYVAKEGLVRNQNGAVMGRWSMEPILNDRVVSYYN